MISEIIIIFGIIYIIVWLFYKDSVSEFRINQVEWAKRGNITPLLSEKVPIVARGIPPISVWTHEDVMNRDIYHSVPIFKDKLLSSWMSEVKGVDMLDCPWDVPHARILGERSAFQTWVDKWLADWIIQPGWKWLWRMYPSCWTGARPMFRTVAPWTAIVPTAGEVMVSILPSKDYDYALPANWRELWIPRINRFDTPFAAELKFMDIRLRPGHILLLPAHWYASWEESDLDSEERAEMGVEVPVMITMMEFHTLFSVIEDWKELKFSSKWRNRAKSQTRPTNGTGTQHSARGGAAEFPESSAPVTIGSPPGEFYHPEDAQETQVAIIPGPPGVSEQSQYAPMPDESEQSEQSVPIKYEQFADIYGDGGNGGGNGGNGGNSGQAANIPQFREYSE
jgi:hypothetical protein